MADVEVGIAAVGIRTGERPRGVEVVGKSVGRGAVDRVGERVRCQTFEAPRQAPLELELEGVIVRSSRIVGQRDGLKVRVHVEKLGYPQEVAPYRAYICERQNLAAS